MFMCELIITTKKEFNITALATENFYVADMLFIVFLTDELILWKNAAAIASVLTVCGFTTAASQGGMAEDQGTVPGESD